MKILVRDAAAQAEAVLHLAAPGVCIAIAGREPDSLLATVLALRGAGADVYGDWLIAGEDDSAFVAAARERFGLGKDEGFDREL